MKDQQAEVKWQGDVPVSARFDDPYYSLENGLNETRHVFLQGNDLPRRFARPLQIAELGFGTGLNFLATVDMWRSAGGCKPLAFTSFEAFPMNPADTVRALAPFQELHDLAERLCDGLAAGHTAFGLLPGVALTLVVGDARTELPKWDTMADAWYLDGFAPARNPELWSAALMRNVASHTKRGGSFATYTAAGFVRRGLEDAGFAVRRVPGFGRKRHMTRGDMP